MGYSDLIHYLDLSPPLFTIQKNSEFSDKYQYRALKKTCGMF